MNKKQHNKQIRIKLAQKKFVYNIFKVSVAMYRNYSVKFINPKKKKKRNSKYSNKTLSITDFKMKRYGENKKVSLKFRCKFL